MALTIVCRDTINCKDTIALCNGAMEYKTWFLNVQKLFFFFFFFFLCIDLYASTMTCICVLTAFRPSFPHLETLAFAKREIFSCYDYELASEWGHDNDGKLHNFFLDWVGKCTNWCACSSNTKTSLPHVLLEFGLCNISLCEGHKQFGLFCLTWTCTFTLKAEGHWR